MTSEPRLYNNRAENSLQARNITADTFNVRIFQVRVFLSHPTYPQITEAVVCVCFRLPMWSRTPTQLTTMCT